VAFCGVIGISPPKCFSKENRLEGEPKWDWSEVEVCVSAGIILRGLMIGG